MTSITDFNDLKTFVNEKTKSARVYCISVHWYKNDNVIDFVNQKCKTITNSKFFFFEISQNANVVLNFFNSLGITIQAFPSIIIPAHQYCDIKFPTVKIDNPSLDQLSAFFDKHLGEEFYVYSKIDKIMDNSKILFDKMAVTEDVKEFLKSQSVMLLSEGDELKGVDQALKNNNILFEEFDVNRDLDIKSAIINNSNNIIFPQLYVKGKLVAAGENILKMAETGELHEIVPNESKAENLNERLKRLINQQKVMLFMKGSPDNPCCGFSRKIVQILRETPQLSDFGHFDILSDNAVREGLKTYSQWSTYPQLYCDGELVGGLDVVKELVENDEIESIFK